MKFKKKTDTQDTAREARTNSSVMYSYGPPHMAKQKQDDQHEHTYSSSVRIRDVALKTCQKRWMIERSGERGSGISMLAPRHDDDDVEYQISIDCSKLSYCWVFCMGASDRYSKTNSRISDANFEGKNAFCKTRFHFLLAQSVGAAEYTDCISAEE